MNVNERLKRLERTIATMPPPVSAEMRRREMARLLLSALADEQSGAWEHRPHRHGVIPATFRGLLDACTDEKGLARVTDHPTADAAMVAIYGPMTGSPTDNNYLYTHAGRLGFEVALDLCDYLNREASTFHKTAGQTGSELLS